MWFLPHRWTIALLVAVLSMGLGCSKAPDDSQLTQQIRQKFGQDSGLQDKSLTVQTSAGVVTLSGRVDNEGQRTAAARYASAIPGIKQVVNNLEVGQPTAEPAGKQTAEAQPPAEMKLQAKPRPSIPRSESRASSGHDPSEWDTPNASSSTMNNGAEPPANQADANSEASQEPPTKPPEPAAPPPAAPRILTIQSGTTVSVRLVDTINSETAQAGETFRATLDSPLSSNGEVAIPPGYNVEGHIVDVKSAGKLKPGSLCWFCNSTGFPPAANRTRCKPTNTGNEAVTAPRTQQRRWAGARRSEPSLAAFSEAAKAPELERRRAAESVAAYKLPVKASRSSSQVRPCWFSLSRRH